MNEIAWSQQSGLPLLATLQALPLFAAALVWRLRERRLAIWLGQGAAALELLLAVHLQRVIDPRFDGFQLVERWPGEGALAYVAGADGVTVLFVTMGALLALLLSVYVVARQLKSPGALLAVLLLVEATLMGQLVTTSLLWFAFGSAAELALIGVVLSRWGLGAESEAARQRFYQFQTIGLLMLFAGTLLVGWMHADARGGAWRFDLAALVGLDLPATFGALAFFLLFYGLAVRTPLFPMHGWLPLVAERGNIAVAPTLLLGVKVGIYGLVRFVFPVLHRAAEEWHNHAIGFAVVGVFYAAFLAFRQRDLRRLLAFAVVSHTSLLIIGLFTLHPSAFQGALLLAANLGLAVTAMLCMLGFVYRRTGTLLMDHLGGLFDRIPLIGIAFLISGLAVVGMPGTPGFDAAHLVLEASIVRYGALLTVTSALGNVLAAGFLLLAFQRAFLAPPTDAKARPPVARAGRLEMAVAVALIALQFTIGFFIEPWMNLLDVPMQTLAARFVTP